MLASQPNTDELLIKFGLGLIETNLSSLSERNFLEGLYRMKQVTRPKYHYPKSNQI